jgi:Cu-Zn family superoxide dismutase
MKRKILVVFACLLAATRVIAQDSLDIGMNHVSRYGVGESIGTINARHTPNGVLFTPNLRGLTPGLHGFHVHENPNCGAGEKDGEKIAGLAAGGHYDPANTGTHAGPYADGHLGDLPALFVSAEGTVTHPVLAPRLKLDDLEGRSLMIHAGGDNYSDQPKPLGGGGARMACGVVK